LGVDRKGQYAISINRLSRDLDVPPNRISEIVNGKRAITANTALRLQRYFGVEAQSNRFSVLLSGRGLGRPGGQAPGGFRG
jgi:hypothetical protein